MALIYHSYDADITGGQPYFLSPLMATAQTVKVVAVGNAEAAEDKRKGSGTSVEDAPAAHFLADGITEESATQNKMNIPAKTTVAECEHTSSSKRPPDPPHPGSTPSSDWSVVITDLDRDQEERTNLWHPTLLQSPSPSTASGDSGQIKAVHKFAASSNKPGDHLKRKKYFNKEANARQHWFETEHE